MSIEAMKQALNALEECRRDPRLKYEHPFYNKTIAALRTAIAEAEKHQAWNLSDTAYRPGGLPQEFVHESENQEPVARLMRSIGNDVYPKKGYTVARTYEELPENQYPDTWEEGEKLYTTPPAAQQEPVADGLIRGYVNALVANKPDDAADATKRMVDYVFATPPAAQWVGFTEAEINEWDYDVRDVVMDVEKLLREKNT
jgi:hypothetical protein